MVEGTMVISKTYTDYNKAKEDAKELEIKHGREVYILEYLSDDFEESNKTLNNTTASQAKDNVKDIVFWGDGDTFKLISKASSKNERWMKSTKAMEIENVGCVVQVTTQQGDNVAEALTFVPHVKIENIYKDDNGEKTDEIIGRKLVSISYKK